MKLKTVRIQNFRCIKDSTEFKVDERVTCLVGKNESGKTALLQALHKLNPTEEEYADFDDLREYPRTQWSDYKPTKETDPAPCLTTTWELEDDDIEEVEDLVGPSARLKNRPVQVSKGYSNRRTWAPMVDEAAAAKHLLNNSNLLDEEREALKDAKDVADLRAALKEIKEPSELQTKLLATLTERFGNGTADAAVRTLLLRRLPRIAYFSEYHRMPGEVSLEDFKKRLAGNPAMRSTDRVFEAFLGLIGATPQDLQSINEFERLQAELEAASSNVSKKIFRYWTQNRHLRVIVKFDQALTGDEPPFNAGYIVRTRIENTRHGSTTSFDERSAGFVWFFSFLVWFSQVKRNFGDNLIILLDEPGLSLHAKAQADLLRYFETELAPNYQVFYTTHSPFMLDPQNLLRARTVEDVFIPATVEDEEAQELGTKVGDDVLSSDRDTVFPLQACLGYEITQTLFIGDHNLLVEGPSDLLYLKWFQRKLAELGREALDRRWTIVPCGGIDKVAAFMSLFRGNELHVAVLADFKAGDKRKIEKLRKSKLLAGGHVFTVDTFAGKPEADIEDILGDGAYCDLVNRCYELSGGNKIAPPREGHSDREGRIVPRVEERMRLMPPAVEEFDHYRPSEFLTEQGLAVELEELGAALDRFGNLFKALNPLLPPP